MTHTPAQELRAAARRLRSGRLIASAELDPLLAQLLETEAASAVACRCETTSCSTQAALVIARQILGSQP